MSDKNEMQDLLTKFENRSSQLAKSAKLKNVLTGIGLVGMFAVSAGLGSLLLKAVDDMDMPNMNARMNEIVPTMKTMTSKVGEMSSELKSANKSVGEMSKSVGEMSKSVSRIDSSADSMANSTRDMGRDVNQLGGSVNQMSRPFSWMPFK